MANPGNAQVARQDRTTARNAVSRRAFVARRDRATAQRAVGGRAFDVSGRRVLGGTLAVFGAGAALAGCVRTEKVQGPKETVEVQGPERTIEVPGPVQRETVVEELRYERGAVISVFPSGDSEARVGTFYIPEGGSVNTQVGDNAVQIEVPAGVTEGRARVKVTETPVLGDPSVGSRTLKPGDANTVGTTTVVLDDTVQRIQGAPNGFVFEFTLGGETARDCAIPGTPLNLTVAGKQVQITVGDVVIGQTGRIAYAKDVTVAIDGQASEPFNIGPDGAVVPGGKTQQAIGEATLTATNYTQARTGPFTSRFDLESAGSILGAVEIIEGTVQAVSGDEFNVVKGGVTYRVYVDRSCPTLGDGSGDLTRGAVRTTGADGALSDAPFALGVGSEVPFIPPAVSARYTGSGVAGSEAAPIQ